MSTSASFDAPRKKISSCVRPGGCEMRASARRPGSALMRLDLPTLERPATPTSMPRICGTASTHPRAAALAKPEQAARPSPLRLLLGKHRLEIVPQLDLGAVLVHDKALLHHRERVVPGPIDHQSGREARKHEREDDRHVVEDHRLRRI